MPVALITLRRANADHAIDPAKEDGRGLRGEFVDVSDGTELYANQDGWQITDQAHYFLFVKGVSGQIDGRPWLDHYRDWLLCRHEAKTHGSLAYSFADKPYQEGERVSADTLSGTVYAVKNETVYGVQFQYGGKLKRLQKVKSIYGHMSGAVGDVRELQVNERNGDLWFVLDNRRGDFIDGEELSFGRRQANKNNLKAIKAQNFNHGILVLTDATAEGRIGEDEILTGQTSGAVGVMIAGSASRLARTKRFLPLSKLSPTVQAGFTAKYCSELDAAEFENCVKRHPDDSLPDRDPQKMDDNALGDDARA